MNIRDIPLRWAEIRQKIRDNPDLLNNAILILFITGALMITLGLVLR
jgi:hypothetical protein